jgi:nitroimidazol reductase NimA-like FMN-containing flavoprotein (pyridoxamine 5'-phosphate oxidase superfamily)
VELDRNGLEVLDEHECLRLLGGARLGRIGITVGALPIVVPVNYLLDGRRILIRTSPGTKLEAAAREAVVAFEVDDIDPATRWGWSVSITGFASPVTDPGDLARVATLPLERWVGPADDEHVIAISTELVSGRRLSARVPAATRP